MQEFPHHYHARVLADPDGPIENQSDGIPNLLAAPPREFGGPGDQWSPETLLVAAVADCFALSFRAVARASRFEWMALDCATEGVLERIERVTRFTRFNTRAKLTIAADADPDKARRLLDKAEQLCLITNSLNAEAHLQIEINQQ